MEGGVTTTYDGNDHTKYRVSYNVTLFASGISHVVENVKVFLNSPENRNETTKLMDITVDICSFFKKGRLGNIFFMETLKFFNKFGKIPTSCPVSA